MSVTFSPLAKKAKAILSLTPGALFELDSTGAITWNDGSQTEPASGDIATAETTIQADADAIEYIRNRVKGYTADGYSLWDFVLAMWDHLVDSDTTGTTAIEGSSKTQRDLDNPPPA